MAQRIYTSSNGDTWDLVRESNPERVRVRHKPNLASGGSAWRGLSRIGIAEPASVTP